MANFLQKTRNPFGDVKEFNPDYSFLTQVYGTRQAEYDRGFNMVKSLYNSALNSTLTNGDNESYRQEVFKKIQGSLRSAGGVDLSQSTNIMRAKGMIDPISKDQDLAYDMAVTEFHQKQKQKMEQYKNSTDPDMRAMYSDFSKMDIQLAEDDIRKAKRGDGSIQKVQPREFVPFEDVDKYLRAAAKEQGVKIEFDQATGSGYIVGSTNGPAAYRAFAQWAKNTMGNRFDRQFQVSGRVQAETAIRNVMQSNGVSREQAVRTVADKILPLVSEQHADKGVKANAALKEYDEELALFKKNHPNGVPVSLQGDYMKLVKERRDYINQLDEAKSDAAKLMEGGADYVAQNLHGIFSSQAKQQSAINWAKSHADATASRSIKPDEVVLTKLKIQSAESINYQTIKSRERIAGAQMAQDERHFGMNYELKVAELQSKTGTPDATYVGQFTSKSKRIGVDVVEEGYKDNRRNVFNKAFGAVNGLMVHVVGTENHGKYNNVLNKVQDISNGSKQMLTAQELALVADYGNKVGVKVTSIANSGVAAAVLDQLAGGTYTKAKKIVEQHVKQGRTKNVEGSLKVFNGILSDFKSLVDKRSDFNAEHKKIAGLVMENGVVKEQYRGATIQGYLNDGTPVLDVSKLHYSLRNQISTVVGKEFNSKTRPSGSIYEINKLTPGEIFSFSNSNLGGATAASADGKKFDMSVISQLPPADVAKLFANSANAAYDPVSKQVKVMLRVSPTEPLAKKLKLDQAQAITLTIPYATLKSNPALSRLAKNVDKNTVDTSPLGMMSEFATNPKAIIESPSHTDNYGYSYSVAGTEDSNGRYGVGITFTYTDPKTKVKRSPYWFHAINNPKDLNEFNTVAESINNAAQTYLSNRIRQESSIDDEEKTPYED